MPKFWGKCCFDFISLIVGGRTLIFLSVTHGIEHFKFISENSNWHEKHYKVFLIISSEYVSIFNKVSGKSVLKVFFWGLWSFMLKSGFLKNPVLHTTQLLLYIIILIEILYFISHIYVLGDISTDKYNQSFLSSRQGHYYIQKQWFCT